MDNLKFQIVSLPAKGPHTVYGDWKLKSSKITKKCYQTSWNKQVFDLCVKIKEVCYLDIFLIPLSNLDLEHSSFIISS